MRTVYVEFNAVMDVKRFVESISSLEGDFDLIDGMYVVDAKSLMGIFGMDLTNPIQLRIQKDSEKALQAVERFIVEKPDDVPDDLPEADESFATANVVKSGATPSAVKP